MFKQRISQIKFIGLVVSMLPFHQICQLLRQTVVVCVQNISAHSQGEMLLQTCSFIFNHIHSTIQLLT